MQSRLLFVNSPFRRLEQIIRKKSGDVFIDADLDTDDFANGRQ
jgi:hypothetical protein